MRLSRPLLIGGVAALGYYMYRREAAGRASSRSGAVSAVTGGFPEDMNQMPPSNDPERDGPIYDGSQLPSPKAFSNS